MPKFPMTETGTVVVSCVIGGEDTLGPDATLRPTNGRTGVLTVAVDGLRRSVSCDDPGDVFCGGIVKLAGDEPSFFGFRNRPIEKPRLLSPYTTAKASEFARGHLFMVLRESGCRANLFTVCFSWRR